MINYKAENPMNAFMGTAQSMQNLQANNMNMQAAYDQQAAAQQAAQKQQEAVAQAQQLLQSGTPDQIAQFGIANPEMMTRITDAVGFKDEGQKKGRIEYAMQVATGAVDPIQATQQRIAQLEAQGMDANHLKQRLSMQPQEIMNLAEKDIAVMNPKGYTDFLTIKGGGITPQQQVTNNLAERKFSADRSDAQFNRDMKRLEFDIKKAKAQGNPVKLAEAEAKKAEEISGIESAYSGTVDTLNLVSEIKNHPGFSSAVGWQGGFPTLGGTDSAGVEGLIETLGSQNFLNAVQGMKGMGALSDAEGKKLQAAIANLDVKQSERDFKQNLKAIESITTRAKNKAESKMKLMGHAVPTVENIYATETVDVPFTPTSSPRPQSGNLTSPSGITFMVK